MGADRRPGILIVDNSVAITGALKAIINATSRLSPDFRFVYVLPENSAALPYLKEKGVVFETLPFVEISKSVKNLAGYVPYLFVNGLRLKKLAEQHQAGIIHMNDFYNLTGIVARIFGCKAKLVTHVRFLPQKFSPVLANFWASVNQKFADKIICVSEAVKSFFPASDKILIIADPIPELENHPEKSINAAGKKEIELLYLSNFIRGKGQNFALEAFKKAYAENKKIRLTFAGGDMGLEKNRQFKQELENDVKASGLQEVIRFESFVEDVEARIKAADILLNFSESESFSLTCLDALFYGTPLIASDCGGPAELFENERSGLRVPNMSVEAMAEAIVKLAADSGKQKSFSQAGKAFVRNKFSPENTYGKLGKTYRQVIGA